MTATREHDRDLPSQIGEAPQAAETYEPPVVESVVTADELAREIQYAGGISEL